MSGIGTPAALNEAPLPSNLNNSNFTVPPAAVPQSHGLPHKRGRDDLETGAFNWGMPTEDDPSPWEPDGDRKEGEPETAPYVERPSGSAGGQQSLSTADLDSNSLPLQPEVAPAISPAENTAKSSTARQQLISSTVTGGKSVPLSRAVTSQLRELLRSQSKPSPRSLKNFCKSQNIYRHTE